MCWVFYWGFFVVQFVFFICYGGRREEQQKPHKEPCLFFFTASVQNNSTNNLLHIINMVVMCSEINYIIIHSSETKFQLQSLVTGMICKSNCWCWRDQQVQFYVKQVQKNTFPTVTRLTESYLSMKTLHPFLKSLFQFRTWLHFLYYLHYMVQNSQPLSVWQKIISAKINWRKLRQPRPKKRNRS